MGIINGMCGKQVLKTRYIDVAQPQAEEETEQKSIQEQAQEIYKKMTKKGGRTI